MCPAPMKLQGPYRFELQQPQPQCKPSFMLQAWQPGRERPFVNGGTTCTLCPAVSRVHLTGAAENVVFFVHRFAILHQCAVRTPDGKGDRADQRVQRVGRNRTRRQARRGPRLPPRSSSWSFSASVLRVTPPSIYLVPTVANRTPKKRNTSSTYARFSSTLALKYSAAPQTLLLVGLRAATTWPPLRRTTCPAVCASSVDG